MPILDRFWVIAIVRTFWEFLRDYFTSFSGLTIAFGASQCKRFAKMTFSTAALAILFNLIALASLILSFSQHRASRRCNDYSDVVRDCIGYDEQSRYLLIQIGLLLLFFVICLALSILTYPNKQGGIGWNQPSNDFAPAGAVFPGVQGMVGVRQHQLVGYRGPHSLKQW